MNYKKHDCRKEGITFLKRLAQQIIFIKWVISVIAAGFLGQFGKSFATYLIEMARKKKAHAALQNALPAISDIFSNKVEDAYRAPQRDFL